MVSVKVRQYSFCLTLWTIQQFACSTEVEILCVFEEDVSETCEGVASRLPNRTLPGSNVTANFTTVYAKKMFRSTLVDIQSAMEPTIPDLLFTVGSFSTANTAAIFSNCYGIPQISFTKDSIARPLFNNMFLRLGPTASELAETFFYVIQNQNTTEVTIIHDGESESDEFLMVIRDLANHANLLEKIQIFGTSRGCENDKSFVRKLVYLRDNGSRLIILHAGHKMSQNIIRCAVKYELFNDGHVWISTKQEFPDVGELTDFPVGMLALEYLPSEGYVEEVSQGIRAITTNAHVLVERQTDIHPGTSDCVKARSDDAAEQFLWSIHENWRGQKVSYALENLIDVQGELQWKKVGVVQKDSIKLETIVWPGGLVFGPFAGSRKFLRVVTVLAPPFVMMREADNSDQECYTDTPCLRLKKTDRVIAYLDAFTKGGPLADHQYEFFCCSGLSVDLLQRLSIDLNFDFLLYFFPNNVNVIGKLINNTWDGAIGQVYTETADMMIGAFSITRARSEWIDFTEPFYHSGYTMMSVAKEQQPEIDAFLQPFSAGLWVFIIAAASCTAIVSSLLEWNSPYGLNPWGRNRNRQYTFGSALIMVYSILCGHIVPTKSPKSWPCRFVQNIWAMCAIFMVSSYTANLAAFMAGKDTTVYYTGVTDHRLDSSRVGIIGETSVSAFIKQLYPEQYSKMVKTNIRSSQGMINLMKEGKFDIFIHDLPILEYARARLDGQCVLRLVGRTFGEDSYGIGLPKGSPWKDRLSKLILSYDLSGFLEDLERNHFYELTCMSNNIVPDRIKYSLTHTGGLFITLGVGMVLGFIILALEHLFYRWVLPIIRNKSPESIFKSLHLMYFSQRLYRSATSEEMTDPAHGAREILSKMKNKQFVELFQKEQKRVAGRSNLNITKTAGFQLTDLAEMLQRLKRLEMTSGEGHTAGEVIDKEGSVDFSGQGTDINAIELTTAPGTSARDQETMSVCSSIHSRHPSLKVVAHDWPPEWETDWLDVDSNCSDDLELETESGFQSGAHDNLAFVMNNERMQDGVSIKRNISLKEADLVRNTNITSNPTPLVKSYSWTPPKDVWTVDKDNVKHKRSRHSEYRPFKGVYGRTPNMKDNRTKSRIRRNTLEQLCRTFSVDLIDPFTLESLTKSELLVLWKASEINLRRRLGEMTRQKESLLSIVHDDQSASNTMSHHL